MEGISNLTPRQTQVVDLLARGHPFKSVALELGISRYTVKAHIYNEVRGILAKSSSSSLVEVAYKYGLSKAPVTYPQVASIQTDNYKEVIEIRVPTRFYWNKDGSFDGLEFGGFTKKLQPWEEDMLARCLGAISYILEEGGEEEEEEEEEGGQEDER